MRIAESHDPEILRLEDNGVVARILGAVLIAAGLALWLRQVLVDGLHGGRERLAAVIVGSALCVVAGLVALRYSARMVIDRRTGQVTRWTRFLWWRTTYAFPLNACKHVAVIAHRGRMRTWSVKLHTEAQDVLCAVVASHAEARQLAQRISAFCGIPLED